MTSPTEGSNEPETSGLSRLNSERIVQIYRNCGIPERFTRLNIADLDTTRRSEKLWTQASGRAKSWQGGKSTERGLLLAGGQGTGKSAAIFLLARAAIKSYLRENMPSDSAGFPKVPIFVREFPEWQRFEFCPQDERNRWNFNSLDEIANSYAIFFDEMTFDARSDAFKPTAEFFYLLVNRLCNMEKPPALYISTNNNSADWEKLFGANLVDRVIGPKHGLCEIIRCDWASYR